MYDVFKIGVGPSSSHTLGPWRAAERFVATLRALGALPRVGELRVRLYGSLAKTGRGHGTDVAVQAGLLGADPVTCDMAAVRTSLASVASTGQLPLGSRQVSFQPERDVEFHMDVTLPYPVDTAADLLRWCDQTGWPIWRVVIAVRPEKALQLGMALPTVKSTYVLDLESIEALERLAREWQVSKSEVLRRVLKQAAAGPAPDRVSLFRQLQESAGLSASRAERWVSAVRAERLAAEPRAVGKRR